MPRGKVHPEFGWNWWGSSKYAPSFPVFVGFPPGEAEFELKPGDTAVFMAVPVYEAVLGVKLIYTGRLVRTMGGEWRGKIKSKPIEE